MLALLIFIRSAANAAETASPAPKSAGDVSSWTGWLKVVPKAG
jgi:hypothetical protein